MNKFNPRNNSNRPGQLKQGPDLTETFALLERLGLPALPVAPAQPADQYPARDKQGKIMRDREGNPKPAFTGKNPSYLDVQGVPHPISHQLYQNRLPTAAELKKWFANPQNGIGTLGGWGNTYWIDLDLKQFNSQAECDAAFASILTKLPGEAWTERTHSGGYRVAVKLAEPPGFTNFALEPGRHHVGEVLGAGRFTVLAPTIGPSGNPYIRLSDADPVEVESLEVIGICSTKKATGGQQSAATPRPVRVAAAGVIDLADLLTGDCRAILEGSDTEGDRSASLTKLIKEAAGWANWCNSQGFGVSGTVEALAAEAGAALGIDGDRVERILKTVDLASCQPAAQILGGDESCWLKVKRLDRATWQQFNRHRSENQIVNFSRLESGIAEGQRSETESSLLEQIQSLLESSLSAVELEAAKISLRKASGATEREFERLWQGVTIQGESDEAELNQSIELLVSAQQAQLKLSDVLPAKFAGPLTQLAQWQNLRPEIYLACLLAVTGTQAKNGTKLVLHRAQDFEVTPNAYFAIKAESSQKKSPVLKAIVKKPLRLLAARDKVEHEYQVQEWKRQYSEAKQNGEDFDTPEPALRVRWYSRATGEAILTQAARVPDQGILCVSDEIAGYFKSANQYRGGRGSDAEDLLEYYDGAGAPVLRVAGVQSDVEDFNFGMIGGLQPKVLQKLLGNCEDSNGNWARWIIFSQPTIASTLPDDQEGFDVTGLLANLYQQISDLPAAEYRLSRPAFKYFQKVYNQLEERRVSEPNAALRAVYGKTAGRIGKLALNLHLIEAVAAEQSPAAEVGLETIKKAVLIAKLAIDQIRAIYTEFGGDDLTANLAKVIDLSKRLGELRARDVQRAFSKDSCPKPETVRQWFAQLTEQGWGVLGGAGAKLTFTAYPDGRRIGSAPTEPESVIPDPEPEPEQPEPAAPVVAYQVGDRVELPDGRTGEIIEASESGFAVQNGKPEPERFEVGQLRLAVGTVVRHRRRGELGQIAGHYPDGYRVNSETWSEVLAESEFEVWRAVPSQTEG